MAGRVCGSGLGLTAARIWIRDKDRIGIRGKGWDYWDSVRVRIRIRGQS